MDSRARFAAILAISPGLALAIAVGCSDAADGAGSPRVRSCGDGWVDPGEACDDGAVASDTEPGACRTDCSGRVPSSSRPPIGRVLPHVFGFGVSSYGGVLEWPGEVQEAYGLDWNYLYWYMLKDASPEYLEAKLQRALELGAIPVITHYQLLDRGTAAGYAGAESWDVVIQAVQDPSVMRDYYDNVQWILETCAGFVHPVIFQTEPDSTSWLRLYHTDGTNDASQGYVAVAASGHPDFADLPDTIAGYAQALIRLRDLYAPLNAYMGLCEFDDENGYSPEDSVAFIQSLGAPWDVLFTHHVVKYSTSGDGWWDAYSEEDQARFLTWLDTITSATGLKYIHWQTEIGASDWGLLPDYPDEERISPLVAAGSIACLFDLQTLDGPPHSTPSHGYTDSPPAGSPAYNSLDMLAKRLARYYASPIPVEF
jgi:hypothetical protein